MLSNRPENFIACDSDYANADIVLLGAPFDGTTSYRPGARFGPKAIRAESYGLESYSPYQDRDLLDLCVFDSGDVELALGDTPTVLAQVEERARIILQDDKIPFMLGGEHLLSLATVRAVQARYPDLHLIHFDAHADLRDDYLGVKLSHACVMRRCWELLGSGRIFQFGIRSGERAEFHWADQGTVMMQRYNFNGLEQVLDSMIGKPVYFSIDLDVLDPSVLPGTGTPEAGGVSFSELHTAMLAVCRRAHVVACDLMELCPVCDPSGISTATAGKLVREMLLGLSDHRY